MDIHGGYVSTAIRFARLGSHIIFATVFLLDSGGLVRTGVRMGRSFWLGSVQAAVLFWLGSLRFASVRFAPVCFASLRFSAVRFLSDQSSCVQLGSVVFGSV